jgi:hypothetical protein
MENFELIDGESLLGRPRFSIGGHSIIFGPYNSPQSYDDHFAETFGSGDPIFDSTNELRFSKTSGLLVSCRLGVPENPTNSDGFLAFVSRLPVQLALPRLPMGTNFQFPPATHIEINDAGTDLVVYRGAAEQVKRRVQVGLDFEFLLGEGDISGFLLHGPSDYLVWGWPFAGPSVSSPALGSLLSRYLRKITSEFVQRLEDGDPEACDELALFHSEATQLVPSPQRDVLIATVASVQDIFCT